MAESPQPQPLQSAAQSAHDNTRSAGPEMRPYEQADLDKLTRPRLYALIRSQPEQHARLRASGLKVNSNSKSDILKTALLSKDHHFGTSAPRKTFEPGYGVRVQKTRRQQPASVSEQPSCASEGSHPGPTSATFGNAGCSPASHQSTELADGPRYGADNAGVPPGDVTPMIIPSPLTVFLKDVRQPYALQIPPTMVTIGIPVQLNSPLGARVAATYDIVQALHDCPSSRLDFEVKISRETEVLLTTARYVIYHWSGAESGIIPDDICIPRLVLPDPEVPITLYVEMSNNLSWLALARLPTSSSAEGDAYEWLSRLAQAREAGTTSMMDHYRGRGVARSLIDKDKIAQDLAWLEGALQEREGYMSFKKNKSANTLTCAEILAHWRFALGFKDEYLSKKFPNTGRPVKLKDIYYVTDRQEFWYRQATDGVELYEMYSDTPAVKDLIEGSTALIGAKGFLETLHNISRTAKEAAGSPLDEA